MPDDTKPSIVDDPDVQDLIRRKARRLSNRSGFQSQDFGDLAQTLCVGLLRRLARLDPNREQSLGFIAILVDQLAANLLRDRRAQKRDDRSVGSLNIFVGAGFDNEFAELAASVTQDNVDARTGINTRSSEEQIQLQADMAAMIQRLPPDLRDLASGLMAAPVADVARATGVPRTTLQSRLRRLREVFERENLQEYL